ncbi:DUF192 domain-containing protein [Sphingomonas sp. MMS24-J13]|uniref:DUF192 domain-containing protein n=1 Tax=Sphingomonas sp. MMS24-J13 TaxID=3238686 RepID=UPI003850494B
MIRSIRAALLALALVTGTVVAPVAARAGEPTAAQHLKAIPLTIHTAHGAQKYMVEVATTPSQQEIGLMFRHSMPAKHGMIFPMDPPRMATFWMKNTFISLDLLFLRPDGTISSIAARVPPRSLDIVPSTEPVGAVLELNAGTAARDGLKPGDKVSW